MWVRKTQQELHYEQKSRRKLFEKYIAGVVAVVTIWVYWFIGSIDKLVSLYITNPELLMSLLLLPLFIYLGYRNYVIHGSAFIERPGKICLSCGIGLGFSDDGWRFKVYNKKKNDWYQIRACKTPDNCDILYQYEVKWVNDSEST